MDEDDLAAGIRTRLSEIEMTLDGGGYRPGPWARLVADLKNEPQPERRALSADVSRVSRKLHRRAHRRTVPFAAGIALEAIGVIVGGILLSAGVHHGSVIEAVAGAALWVTAFQPLVKVAAGYALGVGYEYAYLYGFEPRFKMRFGEYLAAPRAVRVVLHLAGTVGSPLGLWFAAIAVRGEMPRTADAFVIAAWLLIALNAVFFAVGVTGARRIGSHRTHDTSGGAAGIEIREAMGW